MSRQIIHVDMDAFYASVEVLDNPSLKGKPVIVGGSADSRGVVSAASYEARKFGVHSAMPSAQAARLCPAGIFLPVRMERYVELSKDIHNIFESFTARVEPISIDEAFLDVTDCVRVYGSAREIGNRIKQEIFKQTQLTASIGIAPNKFLAKLGSDLEKPDGFVIITEQNKQAILDPLPVSKIWGVGKVSCRSLESNGIRTIYDLRQYPLDKLKIIMGNGAAGLIRLAQGLDDREVETEYQAKSISSERTFAEDIADYDVLRSVLYEEVQHVAQRLRRKNLQSKTVTLKLRYGDFRTITRSQTLSAVTATTQFLWEAALQIFEKWHKQSPGALRLIGFGVSGLTEKQAQQKFLFTDPEVEQQKKVDTAMDKIRKKFGSDSLKRGV
ncbi:MAG: DNA polymerase IV [Planctomycetes bacterium]|nr:DNA polymerase IV [Planctomycetota bacterium]